MLNSYVLRNLWGRRRMIVPTGIGIAATVASTAAMLAIVAGLLGALEDTGLPGNAILLAPGSPAEVMSALPPDIVAPVKILPGVAKDGGQELVSPEYVMTVRYKQPDSRIENITVRGVDPVAFKVHSNVHVLKGELPKRGMPGVLVGSKMIGKIDGLVEGGSIRIAKTTWPVVGTFEAPGTVLDSQIWCDRQALQDLMKRKMLSTVYVTLDSEASQDAFAGAAAKIPGQQVDAMSEPAFYHRLAENVDLYRRAIVIVILVLAIGAAFACTNAMYTLFLGRIRELATLMAIGYTRGQIIRIVLKESVFFTILCGLVGVAAAMLVHGRVFSYADLDLEYRVAVTLPIIGVAMGLALAIGILGGLASIVQAVRMNVLAGLRSI